MTDKPLYRWELRRAAKARRENLSDGISTHDLVILAVIMAMLVIVVRLVFIFGITQGMQFGPFITDVGAMPYEPSPYVNLPSVNDSFENLTAISVVLFIYWLLASWKSFASNSVSLSTKLFKSILGISTLVLLAVSIFPDHAIFLAEIWFDPPYHPQQMSTTITPDMNGI